MRASPLIVAIALCCSIPCHAQLDEVLKKAGDAAYGNLQ